MSMPEGRRYPAASYFTEASPFDDDVSLLSLLLAHNKDSQLLIDLDLKIRLFNDTASRQFRQYFNRTVKQGDCILDFAQPSRREVLRSVYADVFTGNQRHTEVQFYWNNILWIFESVFIPVKDKTGAVIGALVTVYDVTEKEAIKKALVESDERMRFALEGSNHGVWDWNIKTGAIIFSSSWRKAMGFKQDNEENDIEEWTARIHPEDKDQLNKDLHTHFNSGEAMYENSYRLRAADGSYRWIMGRGKIIEREADGTPLRMLGTHTDITEKKKSEEQYRELFDLNPLPSWIYDFETLHFLAVNQAAIEHLGFTKEEFLNMTITDLHPADQMDLFNKALHERDKQTKATYINWPHRKKNGTVIISEMNSTTLVYNNRKARLVIVNDVTKKVAAEEELKKTNQRFKYATKASSDAIYDWDIVNDKIIWGAGMATLFGYHTNEVMLREWEAHVHPDDQQCISKSLDMVLYHSRKKLWKVEYRFLKSDGTYRFVLEKGFILRDAQNKPLRMIGAMQDITDFRQKQLELIESNKRYEYATLATADVIWDFDVELGSILWSDNYEKIMGWKLPENNRLPIEICLQRIHEDDRNEVLETLSGALSDEVRQIWEGTFRYIKVNGEFAHVYNRGYILRNESGAGIRVIGAMQDITNRKRLEEQLLQKELDKQKVISKATIDTQERERSEIGKELHDNVNQVLTTTKLYLELALSNPDMKDDLLQKSQQNIMYVINEIRQLSRSLMNPSLGDLGLVDAINDLAENIRATGKLQVIFETGNQMDAPLSESLELTIYRIIQEALNNTVKHAAAKTVFISLQRVGKQVELRVQDDGIGFDKDDVKKGAGLKSIQNRVYLFNGTLQLESAPAQGCTLTIRFNL